MDQYCNKWFIELFSVHFILLTSNSEDKIGIHFGIRRSHRNFTDRSDIYLGSIGRRNTDLEKGSNKTPKRKRFLLSLDQFWQLDSIRTSSSSSLPILAPGQQWSHVKIAIHWELSNKMTMKLNDFNAKLQNDNNQLNLLEQGQIYQMRDTMQTGARELNWSFFQPSSSRPSFLTSSLATPVLIDFNWTVRAESSELCVQWFSLRTFTWTKRAANVWMTTTDELNSRSYILRLRRFVAQFVSPPHWPIIRRLAGIWVGVAEKNFARQIRQVQACLQSLG